MEIAILYSSFFQNIYLFIYSIYTAYVHHQDTSIVKCFQKFLHENYPIVNVYVYFL